MNKKYHFISGLPRAGSTALTSILNQNPKFHSNLTDNLIPYMVKILEYNEDPPIRSSLTENQIKNTIIGMFDGFYKEIDKEVIFNCSRGATKYVEYLYRLNSNFKIICCVREIRSILNSFEKINKRKTLREPPVSAGPYNPEMSDSVRNRTEYLANGGIVGRSYEALREAYYGIYKHHLLLVEYNDLTQNPTETMKRIYDFIEEPMFDHDFDNIEYSNVLYDDASLLPNLHTVRKQLSFSPEEIALPPDLWEKYSNIEFWRK